MEVLQNRNSVPLLVCGDVQGKFKKLFRMVTKLNKEKGPFEALYCVGDFFGDCDSDWDSVKSGEAKAPAPCYILGPSKQEQMKYFSNEKGAELAPNIIHLGKKGILTTASGLKVAYLSGIEGKGHEEYVFTAKDVTELQHNFQALSLKGVDFLLTSQWPRNVTKNLPTNENKDLGTRGSELISYLAVTLKPCYHFAGLEEIFYERVPYRNISTFSSSVSHSTRFIGLANVGNDRKMQFFYGINHIPLHVASQEYLQSCRRKEVSTECPYKVSIENRSDEVPKTNFQMNPEQELSKPRGGKNLTKMPDCWFCLSLSVDEHLIITVGFECYVALAKGWLVPDHLLILPIAHYKSAAHLPDDVNQEIEEYKCMLRRYFHAQNKVVVFFERNYKSPHMQLQAVAIPDAFESVLEKVFLQAALNEGITLEEIPPYSIMKQLAHNEQFFYLEIGGKKCRTKKFFCVIAKDFPLDFARNVLASQPLLNVPHKADWKKCVQPKEEEALVCKDFRDDFKQFIKL